MKKTIKIIIIVLGCILAIGLISSLFSGRSNSSGTSSPTNKPTTQAPGVESTEDPEIIELREAFPVYFGAKELLNVTSDGYTVRVNNGNVHFYNQLGTDMPIYFFKNRVSDLGATGQYFFMKYSIATDSSPDVELFAGTDSGTAVADHSIKLKLGTDIFNDGEWHLLAIDLSEHIDMPTQDDKYYLQHLRLDVEGEINPGITIQYAGVTDDPDDIVRYVKATENNVADLHTCSSVYYSMVSSNEYTHVYKCAMCGNTEEASHSGADYGIWSDELGYYVSHNGCSTCGQLYNFGSTIYFEAEDLKIGETGYNSRQTNSTEGDVTYAEVKSLNGAGTFCNTRFNLNPNGIVTGEYLVFKYKKAPGGNNKLEINTGLNSGRSSTVIVNLIDDGEWHIANVSLTTIGFDSTSVFSLDSRLNITSWATDESICFDWFRMYDNINRMPSEYMTSH